MPILTGMAIILAAFIMVPAGMMTPIPLLFFATLSVECAIFMHGNR